MHKIHEKRKQVRGKEAMYAAPASWQSQVLTQSDTAIDLVCEREPLPFEQVEYGGACVSARL